MKTLMNKTLVALSMAILMTPSLAVSGELPVSQSEKDSHSVTAATAPAPLFALSRLDAETLAAQEMTDQELKAVEGAGADYIYKMDLGLVRIYVWSDLNGDGHVNVFF